MGWNDLGVLENGVLPIKSYNFTGTRWDKDEKPMDLSVVHFQTSIRINLVHFSHKVVDFLRVPGLENRTGAVLLSDCWQSIPTDIYKPSGNLT